MLFSSAFVELLFHPLILVTTSPLYPFNSLHCWISPFCSITCWLSIHYLAFISIMNSFTKVISWSAIFVTASAHGVILGAQGPAGPSSFGFKGMHSFYFRVRQKQLIAKVSWPCYCSKLHHYQPLPARCYTYPHGRDRGQHCQWMWPHRAVWKHWHRWRNRKRYRRRRCYTSHQG